jgi:WD40 repeat protein
MKGWTFHSRLTWIVGVLACIATTGFGQEQGVLSKPENVKNDVPRLGITVRHTNRITSAAFSPDMRHVLTGSWDKTARLWEVATGREILRFEGHTKGINSVRFSPSGRWVLTGSRDQTARLWEVATGREIRRFGGNSGIVLAATFSPDGRQVLTGSTDRAARLWEVDTGRATVVFTGHSKDVSSVAFSPDGRWVLTGSRDMTARLWETGTGREIQRFEGHSKDVNSVSFSPDGRRVLTGSRDKTARLWEVATGREIRRFEGHSEDVNSVSFSPDGRRVLTGSSDRTARLWDVATGRETWRFKGHYGSVTSVAFSSDGRQVLTSSEDKTVRLWDIITGREIQRFSGHSNFVGSAAFSSGGREVLTGSWDNTARLWSVATGHEIQRFKEHSDFVVSVKFSPDGRKVLTGSRDGTVRIWQSDTGEELARLISFDDGSWAVVDKDGRFDAPGGGQSQHLYWIVGDETIDLEQLKERYYEPGLLAKKLGLNPEPLRDVKAFTSVDLHPQVSLNQPSVADPRLQVNLTNRGGGIGRVVVRLNGKEMSTDARPKSASSDAKTLDLQLALSDYAQWLKPGQQNRIEVEAYNAEGYLRSRTAEVLYDAPGETHAKEVMLWAVIVGVSDYAGEQIDLRYAAKDAEDIAKAVELGAHRFFGADRAHIRLLTTGQPSEKDRPTKTNIDQAFKVLEQAKADDIVVVYLSGHGAAWKDTYYFPTMEAHSTNLEDPEIRDKRAISSEEIASWLIASKAQKQVIVLDTCAAGAAMKSFTDPRAVSSDQIRALDRLKDRTGVHVLMGSAADRVSYEASQFEQGLLTHTLLRGMKGAALREEQYVDVTKLFNYAADEVPILAANIGGIQRPHIASPKGANTESFDIGKLIAEDRSAINLRSPRPFLLRPSLLNKDKAYDDLKLEPALRQRFREASFARARGDNTPTAVFTEAEELPGAIRPSGQYSVEGTRISARIVLLKDAETKELNIDGQSADVDGFIGKMMESIVQTTLQWK